MATGSSSGTASVLAPYNNPAPYSACWATQADLLQDNFKLLAQDAAWKDRNARLVDSSLHEANVLVV